LIEAIYSLYEPGYTNIVWLVLSWGSEARAVEMVVKVALFAPFKETITAPSGGTIPLLGWPVVDDVVFKTGFVPLLGKVMFEGGEGVERDGPVRL
jgi:hypothetical protein